MITTYMMLRPPKFASHLIGPPDWKISLDVLPTQNLSLDWRVIGWVTELGVAGNFAHKHFAKRVPQAALQLGFAYFLIVTGSYILAAHNRLYSVVSSHNLFGETKCHYYPQTWLTKLGK